MQFLVVAHDGTDADAPARRQAARPAHIESIKALKEAGAIVCAGALLDEDERMIGSALIVEFENRAELDTWLVNDPYSVEGVWRNIEVTPFRRAV